jgi:hypothetical protein
MVSVSTGRSVVGVGTSVEEMVVLMRFAFVHETDMSGQHVGLCEVDAGRRVDFS